MDLFLQYYNITLFLFLFAETFSKFAVTFEDLCSNPSLLTDPKLVVRINERYYNWQIAAPMLLSHVVFEKPLKKVTMVEKEERQNP